MNKQKLYVCHYAKYSGRLKRLPDSYDYKIVSIGDDLPMPASLNRKHYHIMSLGEDALIIEDDINLPSDWGFEKMIWEAKEQSLDIVFFGGVSKSVEESWGMSVSVDSPSEGRLVYHQPSYLTRCTHGYWIGKSACKKILELGEDYSQPIDHAINNYIQKLGLKVGWTSPCVYQSSLEALNGQKTIPHFYHLTEGEDWFTYPTLYSKMVEIAPHKAHFVEVGVWKGRSAAFLAVEAINSGKNITIDLVDTWEGSIEHQPMQENVYDVFFSNIQPVLPYVNICRMTSLEASSKYENESLDFVFIDAAHDYDSVKADINAWLPKVKKGGYLAGHDYPTWPGVTAAVNEIFGEQNILSGESCWLFPVQ